jgi:hypothetical protein
MRTRLVPTAAASLALLLSVAPAWADFTLERRLTLTSGGTFSLETERRPRFRRRRRGGTAGDAH